VRAIQVALIGDYDPAVTAHQAIPQALALAGSQTELTVQPRWIHTTELTRLESLATADGVWCVPASPYANTTGALAAIRMARTAGIPFLGTCGGFQHVLLEAAGSLWHIESPTHAELSPEAVNPVVAPLTCSLIEVSGPIRFAPGSRIASAYGRTEAVEQYHCRYGLNPFYIHHLASGPLQATAWDPAGEVRAVELGEHAFFVATLFQPERAALAGAAPPLVSAFLRAIAARAAG
jgi:CTP synthase (UTP-ammonia lyase)